MKTAAKKDSLKRAYDLVSSGMNKMIHTEIERGIDEALKRFDHKNQAKIESAVNLTEDEKLRLGAYIESIFKQKFDIEYCINQTILGGIKLTIGDWKLDITLNRQIDTIKNLFKFTHG